MEFTCVPAPTCPWPWHMLVQAKKSQWPLPSCPCPPSSHMAIGPHHSTGCSIFLVSHWLGPAYLDHPAPNLTTLTTLSLLHRS